MGAASASARGRGRLLRMTFSKPGGLMADPLVEVAVRVYAEFADRATLAEVLAVVGRAAPIWTPPAPRRYPKWSSDWPGNGSPITSPRVPPATDLDLADTDRLLDGPVRADAVGPVADAARIVGVIPSLEQLVEFLDRVRHGLPRPPRATCEIWSVL